MFSAERYRGNPLAVVLDADGLSTEDMQQFANWTNLSETTFVLPPASGQADYRVRIFTPAAELPFAGHPVLGTGALLAIALGRPSVVLETGAGPVAVELRNGEGDAVAAAMAQPIPGWAFIF